MKQSILSTLICSLFLLSAVHAQAPSVGSVTPQVQFMNAAQQEAQKAAEQQAKAFDNEIENAEIEDDTDRKAHKLVSERYTKQRADMIHTARQEANKLLTEVVPNSATIKLTQELQTQLDEVYTKTKVAFAKEMMKLLEGVEKEISPVASAPA